MVVVNVEYCGVCHFERQCNELKEFLKRSTSDVEINCVQGRRGSFEVSIDGQLIYSKLQTLAFPEEKSVLENVERVKQGLAPLKVVEKPIDNCSVM